MDDLEALSDGVVFSDLQSSPDGVVLRLLVIDVSFEVIENVSDVADGSTRLDLVHDLGQSHLGHSEAESRGNWMSAIEPTFSEEEESLVFMFLFSRLFLFIFQLDSSNISFDRRFGSITNFVGCRGLFIAFLLVLLKYSWRSQWPADRLVKLLMV